MYKKVIDKFFSDILINKDYQERIKFYALINCFTSAFVCITYIAIRVIIRTGVSLPTMIFCLSLLMCVFSVIDLKLNKKIRRFLTINLTNGYLIAVCNNIFSGGFTGTNGTFLWALIIIIVGIIYFDERRVKLLLLVYVVGFVLLFVYQLLFQQHPTLDFTGDIGHYTVNLLGFGFLIYSTFSIFVQDLIKELNNASEQAQKNAKIKSDFMSQMSHEIRTPLNVVIGMIQIAQRNSDDPKRVANALGHVEEHSQHLLKVINDILDYSKIDANRLQLENKSFSIIENIEFLQSMFEMQAIVKGVTFSVSKEGIRNEYIIADQLRLNQVLINLLSNAVKFTEKDGAVSLTIEEKFNRDGFATYYFAISDNGIGMEANEIENLFVPFMQANSGISRTHGGTGLGLAISQRICHLMGGEINMNSTLGVGSKFYFELTFPVGEEIPRKALMGKSCEEVSFKDKRILVVDDIEINREIVVAMLENTGVIIDHAVNGDQAVNLFMQSPEFYYDLILMDLQMPVMDGFAATGAIRRSGKSDSGTIPIIALSANVISEDVERARNVGINIHLAKPVEYGALEDALKQFL